MLSSIITRLTEDTIPSFLTMDFDAICDRVSTLDGSYRILYTPRSTWSSPYLFMGINPAGVATDPADVSVEAGNAYLTERWGAGGTYNPLQKQVKGFFDGLAERGFAGDWCVSNLVFYRSPSWETMAKQKAHVDLCLDVWSARFAAGAPRVIVTNGYGVYTDVILQLRAANYRVVSSTAAATPWDGPHTSKLTKGAATVTLIGFPHLSRYGVVTRAKNAAAMSAVYDAIMAAS